MSRELGGIHEILRIRDGCPRVSPFTGSVTKLEISTRSHERTSLRKSEHLLQGLSEVRPHAPFLRTDD